MEKVYIIFSERTQYAGNKVVSVHEALYPNFYESERAADEEISRVIANIASIGSNNSVGRHIVISGDIQYRFRISELRKA